MKEHKIGEEFTYKGIKLKVVESNSRLPCTICYFKGEDCSDKVLNCFEWDRINNKKVHFELIKNNDDLITKVLESTSYVDKKKIETKMLIAAKISNALKSQNMSKDKLMAFLGEKSQSEVSEWLSGTYNFTIDTLIEIENILEIKLLNFKVEE